MHLCVETVWALRVPPDDEAEDLHEFALAWYRFSTEPGGLDPTFKQSARPAVWVRFGNAEHLERFQAGFPEAKLGPSSRFTEALILLESWKDATALQPKVLRLLGEEREEGLERIIRQDALEDY